MYLKRINNNGKSPYSGVYMNLTYILPGAVSLASLPNISKEAKNRLKWFDYYRKRQNAAKTCRYFGITSKTFYKWKKRYNPHDLTTLEEKSRRPHNTRNWEVSRREEFLIRALRKQHIRWGKMKIARLYKDQHHKEVSSWKVQRVIEKHSLYYEPAKTEKMRKKRKRNQHKKRVTELKKETRDNFLIALDTVVIYWAGMKRYIFTAIDVHNKIAYARMYVSKSSKNAKDFVLRLDYLLEHKIENITKDNGTEFEGEFRKAIEELGISHYYSRVKTPTDNPFDERFNRTLKDEFISLGHMTCDCAIFNKNLTEWLIEYNFVRPHQSLGYETPVAFNNKYSKVLPMYPSCS